MTSMAAFLKRKEERFEASYEKFLCSCAFVKASASIGAARSALGQGAGQEKEPDALVGDGLTPERVAAEIGPNGKLRQEAMQMLEDLDDLAKCALALDLGDKGAASIISYGSLGEYSGLPKFSEALSEAEKLAAAIAKRAAASPVMAGFCGLVANVSFAAGPVKGMLGAALEREGLGKACSEAQAHAEGCTEGQPARKPKSV